MKYDRKKYPTKRAGEQLWERQGADSYDALCQLQNGCDENRN
jgi:hypothetical protein